MKKLISLLLVAALALSLTACGGGAPSKEEMLKEAETLDFREYAIDNNANTAAAEEEYNGNTYIVSGYVEDIYDNHVTIEWCKDYKAYFTAEELERIDGDEFFTMTESLDVYPVNDEDLYELQKGTEVTFVGILEYYGSSNLTNAYLVTE